MIRKFTVRNFKNFKNPLILDLSKVHDYKFNDDLIKNGIVNKMLIYGPNNSGKSNLGAAIMDITCHLTDNHNNNPIYGYYVNGDSINEDVSFSYEFQFDEKNVVYNYRKDAQRRLISEELIENGVLVFSYNYKTNKYENNIPEAQTLDISKNNTTMSALKYLYNNTLYWPENSTIKLMMSFVNNMLWFRSLRRGNEFMGVMPNGEDLNDFIINNRLLKSFEKFLNDSGQQYKLSEISEGGQTVIGVKYKNFTARFDQVASTGTLSLWLFFYWMNRTKNISFIYLDEFDAFYHFSLSSHILKYVNSKSDFQSILTSHNTYLIDNEQMRPDCYAMLKDGSIASFADSTNRVIRQGHNLEKMMLGGEFEK